MNWSLGITPPRMRARAQASNRHATWLELFFDLVFVVVIAQVAHAIKDHLTVSEVLMNVALFLPVWWIWAGHTVYATRFDTDDVYYRVLTFGQMFAVAVIAVELHHFDPAHSSVYAVAYVLARVLLLILLLRAHRHLPGVRKATRLYLTGFGMGALFWIIAFAVPAPERFLLWGIGFGIDFVTPWIGWWRKILADVPVDATHVPERFGLLNIIVLGEAVVGLVAGVSSTGWTLPVLIMALLAFATVVVIWWSYFTYLEEVSKKICIGSGQPYMYSHLLFILGVAGIGIGIQLLIVSAHDPVTGSGAVWTYCVGAMLWAIAFYAIQQVSTPHMVTSRLNWRYLSGLLAFVVVAWFGVAWPALLVQIIVAGIFLCFLVLPSRRRRDGMVTVADG